MDTRDKHWWPVFLLMLITASVSVGEELPDLEFLEYLSDWQDDNGELLEPAMFDHDVEYDDKATEYSDADD